ncbi:hypothetical protein [Xenorhabdus stockiae]|uniref:hypothetical protein n=1 Tax=Xenorhabdus stockiae TaxID=351614 RepID=UPI004064391C
MNAKSKIFLALALVLSVTACSKGGGSHSSFKGGGGGTGTTGPNGHPQPSTQNTYIAYKPDPSDNENANVSPTVGKNVWFAPSGDYVKLVGSGDGKEPAQNQQDWGQNMGDPQDYYYIQLGRTGTPIDISTNPGKPHYTVFKNKAKNATLGRRDPDIFLASPWMKVEPNSGGTYHGPVVFQQDLDNIRNDLTMTLTIVKDTGSIATDNGTVSGYIYDNNTIAASLPAKHISDLVGGYQHMHPDTFKSENYKYGFLDGQHLTWGYTDKEANGISGILGVPGNTKEFGAFLLDKKSE